MEGPLEWSWSSRCPAPAAGRCRGCPRRLGFTPVDAYGRIPGGVGVPVGDMTTRPLKQGGLATQQADVAASERWRVPAPTIEVRPAGPCCAGCC